MPIAECVDDVPQHVLDHLGGIYVDNKNAKYPIIPSTILDYSSGSVRLVRQGVLQVDCIVEGGL